MRFYKQRIDEIFKCYAVNAVEVGGATHLLFAGEGPGCCNLYKGPDFTEKQVLWEGGGGTMTLVALRDRPGEFLASKGFYSMVEARESAIYLASWRDGIFRERRLFDLPFLHRFDVLTIAGRRFFVGSALHAGKKDKEDWSTPGRVLVAELPGQLEDDFTVELQEVAGNIFRNHGFNRGLWRGSSAVFVAGDNGVMAIMPPQGNSAEWRCEQLFSHPVSDVAAIDLDGDGQVEFALLSPFHGDRFEVMKKIDGAYQAVFSYPGQLDFYHAIFADTFNGVPSFVIGARKNAMDLFLVQYDQEHKRFASYLIDTGVGPGNARIVHTREGDIIMSANRQINEAAIYRLAD